MVKKPLRLLFLLLPIGYAELFWLASGQPVSLGQFAGVVLLSLTAISLPQLLGWNGELGRAGLRKIAFPMGSLLAGSLFFLFIGNLSDLASYLCFSVFASLLLVCVNLLSGNLRAWMHWIAAGAMALLFGAGVIGALQVIERFSEEEFFAGIQLALLSGWWFFLFVAWWGIVQSAGWPKSTSPRRMQAAVWASISVAAIFGGGALLWAYQASFYPQTVALYPGISAEKPFLCGDLLKPEPSTTYTGDAVFQGIIDRAVPSPNKTVAELGMLALATQDPSWIQAFHQGLLDEARQAKYTGPAGSVKFGQYEMAVRAYYFQKITQSQPDLFTRAETQEIMRWFSAVNRRSLTVEWVDWMYASAFGEWPKGPYLNQENGSSLLALLEAYGYADSDLQSQNQAFLRDHRFGWATHFRNTDDSIYYQTLWINNAIFQSVLNGQALPERIQKSFEWMLLQAPPDGSPVGYNPEEVTLAESAYLGAQMTGDGRLLWLAGRSLDFLKAHTLFLYSQPGLEKALQVASVQPTVGSCLLYGDSGTPIRLGPLAADKIVFRDGWQASDRYLNLNLRFTGWHRYKAPNAIISIYQEEPLIKEQASAPRAGWLPVGRSMFRDKRMPRENLNGVIIPRAGASRLVYWLTGFGSSWAQDPPFYASVDQFTTGPDMDQSVTTLDWNGWKQTRSIYFVHDGPTVIIDAANGPHSQTAGVVWHALVPADSMGSAVSSAGENSFLLGSTGQVEMRLVPYGGGVVKSNAEKNDNQPGRKVIYTGRGGSVKLVTLFLSGDWREATVKSLDGFLLIQLPSRTVKISLPPNF